MSAFRRPEVVTRAEWRADESLRFGDDGDLRYPMRTHRPAGIVLHHTKTSSCAEDPRDTLRRIHRFHSVDRGWADIGYHFLVDRGGVVYQGRFTEDLWGDGGGVVVGAHALGFNEGTVGIALLGTFLDEDPSDAAWDSLTGLVTALALTHDIDPSGRDVDLEWKGRSLPHAILTHADLGTTSCPGERVRDRLPELRRSVSVDPVDA